MRSVAPETNKFILSVKWWFSVLNRTIIYIFDIVKQPSLLLTVVGNVVCNEVQ